MGESEQREIYNLISGWDLFIRWLEDLKNVFLQTWWFLSI